MPPSDPAPSRPPLELWGGLECTVNRVGDRFFDQVARGGHDRRPEDLDRIAALGIRTLRYPVLWERTAPDGPERADWRWADARLGRLRRLGVRPIVGLVHHGSGPRGTDLLDPAFPDLLAAYAGAVARRYPWVADWTPVNEPLTTARFAALYGHWYPHRRDDRAFARALVNQCRAVVLAMRAVREVTPAARLVQTEDLGKVAATPALATQAWFENERRWLGFDLLCGRVDRAHPLWGYLHAEAGIPAAELEAFLVAPCPPDIVGVNHYPTSERFLDERPGRYPPHTHGGNGRLTYADLEAVRVRAEGTVGAEGLLRETWARYGRPVAVTECHLGCTREEQLRWLWEVWAAARALRAEGADVRAVTVWALLGSFDWDSLATRDAGRYEPGAFDLRAAPPRPTALAALARDLAAGREPDHPVLAQPGWWRRPDRLAYPPVDGARRGAAPSPFRPPTGARPAPLLVLAADAGLAAAVARACERRGLAHAVLDLGGHGRPAAPAVPAALDEFRPWAAVLAGEPDPGDAGVPGEVAAACAARGLALAWCLAAPTGPAGGPSAPLPGVLAVRPVAPGWTPGGPPQGSDLADGEPGGRVACPAGAPAPVDACLDLLLDGERGPWQVAPDGTPCPLDRPAPPAPPAPQTPAPGATPELGDPLA